MVVEGFDIIRSLGIGATSEVFEAKNQKTGRKVALKAFSQLIQSDPELLSRLESEVEILHALRHPNIVTLLSHIRGGESFVLELELIEGGDLRKWLKTYDVPLNEPKFWLLAQLARGLGAAHEMGVIHRDLKPENILVSRDGEVKITDFGLARQINRLTITRLGLLIGSLGYMAPELINGAKANEKSDIFSYGVIAFEVLCGRAPFEGETPQAVIKQITDGTIQPIRSMNPQVPERIALAIEKCLDKDPLKRPESIWFLEAELMTHASKTGLLPLAKNLVSQECRSSFLTQSLKIKHSYLKAFIEKSKESGDRKETVSLITEMMALFPNEEGMDALLAGMQATEKNNSFSRYAPLILLLILVGVGVWKFNSLYESKSVSTESKAEQIVQPIVSAESSSAETPEVPAEKPLAITSLPKETMKKPPSQAAGYGSIKFDVDPDVEIYVNGGLVPQTQWSHFPIVTGTHRVRMAKYGFVPIDSEVKVMKGKVALIRARGNSQ